MTTSSASPNILLVKLSSLGDVLHNLPIVWDIRARLPNARIDWVVEEGYAHLLEPLLTNDHFRGIDRIIPFGLRRWKKSILSLRTWREYFSFRRNLQRVSYDVIIETQGLLKSALVCALAKKSPDAVVAGLANATEYSGYESISKLFYSQSVQVPFRCHAIDRSRYVACSAFDWPLIGRDENVEFYPQSFIETLGNNSAVQFKKPYVIFFHSTARAAKRWGNEAWVDVGQCLSKIGYQVVLPWGSPREKKVSEELAEQIPNAVIPEAFSIEEAFAVIANSSLVIGVDSGLTHLAAVLNKPTIEIYCDSPRWKTDGYWSSKIRNLGDMKTSPAASDVIAATNELLAQ
ncbi:lipopolysaccharide heptosyltransferase I [Polynucleobacter sp. MWH-UH19D]|uniref:lipopolysaccharide heptosyltransferase I n=1 Tax=Polynucleobacter sp. MWH-UH19D TaxID=1855610 RepID=UPI003364BB34